MIIEFFVRQKKFAQVFSILMLIIGLLAFSTIQRDQFPNVDFEEMHVYTSYPNASPIDVEEDVTELIEEKIQAISGIDFYTSTSQEGLSRVFIRIDQESDDIDQVKQDIRTEITSITGLPDDVTPRVIEINTSRQEAIRVNIAGNYNMFELEKIAKNLKDRIQQVEGVSEISEDGNIDTQIQIYLKPELLKKYRLSLKEILAKAAQRNFRYTAGDNNEVGSNSNIVVLEQFKTVEDIRRLIVKSNFDGDIIYLEDIADIVVGPAEISDILRVNGKTGYELKVRKTTNSDVIKTIDDIKEVVNEFQSGYGDKLEIFYTRDRSKYVRNRLEIVTNNAIIGLISVVIVLGIFLNLRTAFWVSVGMGVVLTGIATLLLLTGQTINIISLAAIILVLGLVVDDSIIVSESIEKIKAEDNTIEGIAKGYKRVIKPVLTTIITSIIAMGSMFFMQGTMGKFIYVIPVVVILALALSFIEITFALPAHLNNNRVSKPKKWFKYLENKFVKFIEKILNIKYIVITLFVLMAIFSMYFAINYMNKTLFPAEGSDLITARLKTDIGFDLKQTSDVSLKVENTIIQSLGNNIEFISSDVGGSSPNKSDIYIRLTPVTERDKKAPEIMEELKEATKDIASINKLDFSIARPGPPQGADIEVVLISSNDDERQEAADTVKQILATIDGVSDISSDDDEGKQRIQILFDFDKMSRLGISFADVRNILTSAFSGLKIAKTKIGDIDVEYVVFLGKDSKIDILNNLTISNNMGRIIPLSGIIKINNISGEPNYHHYNGKRSITVNASVDDKKTNSVEVSNKVKDELNAALNYPNVLLLFEGGTKDTQQSMQSFAIAFLFAIAVIYLILIILFNSWTQPLIILSAVPFAFIGVIWAFYFHGEPISFFTLLGSLALIGVVVNDSLVMVSHLNYIKTKNSKENLKEWIARGSADRLRAVVLTSITTLVGVIPLAYGIGGVDIFLQPMVLALGYGLLFGTVITLILIPCFYMMNYEITSFFKEKFSNKLTKK